MSTRSVPINGEVFAHNQFHVWLMIFTAGLVIVRDFLTGVLAAIIIYAMLHRYFDRRRDEAAQQVSVA